MIKANELDIIKNYTINIKGEVRNIKTGRLLKPDLSSGYARVVLSNNKQKKRFLVHRLVAIEFIENPENKPCVNHIDGNKLNNHVSNLEWCTYSENERHSFDVLGKQIKHSTATKEKIGLANKGKKISKKHKDSISKAQKNKTPWNKGIKQKDYVKK